MAGGVATVQYDNDPLIYGTQKRAGVTITDIGKDFKSCGALTGLAVRNTTSGASGHIVSVTEDTATTDISFALGDKYEIYHTATYNSRISTLWTDRRYGLKVTNKNELINGYFPDDRDVDEQNRRVFGPGEPWETHVR